MSACRKRGCAGGIPSSIKFDDKRKGGSKSVSTDAGLLGKRPTLTDKTGQMSKKLTGKKPI